MQSTLRHHCGGSGVLASMSRKDLAHTVSSLASLRVFNQNVYGTAMTHVGSYTNMFSTNELFAIIRAMVALNRGVDYDKHNLRFITRHLSERIQELGVPQVLEMLQILGEAGAGGSMDHQGFVLFCWDFFLKVDFDFDASKYTAGGAFCPETKTQLQRNGGVTGSDMARLFHAAHWLGNYHPDVLRKFTWRFAKSVEQWSSEWNFTDVVVILETLAAAEVDIPDPIIHALSCIAGARYGEAASQTSLAQNTQDMEAPSAEMIPRLATALACFSRGVCSGVLDGEGTPLHGIQPDSFFSIFEPIAQMLGPQDLTNVCSALVQHGPIQCKQRCACAFPLGEPLPKVRDPRVVFAAARTYKARDTRPAHLKPGHWFGNLSLKFQISNFIF